MSSTSVFFFFFNDTATTEIYTLSLHDALPISKCRGVMAAKKEDKLGWRAADTRELVLQDAIVPKENVLGAVNNGFRQFLHTRDGGRIGLGDRKSTRLNSSHGYISYAVFCLKKKNIEI